MYHGATYHGGGLNVVLLLGKDHVCLSKFDQIFCHFCKIFKAERRGDEIKISTINEASTR